MTNLSTRQFFSELLLPKKHPLITGTLLLTATGFVVRLLGFFYRIFLSRTIGAEGLGLYNMVHPIYGICFALCAGSIQTAISRFVAASLSDSKKIFATGLIISLTISIGLSGFIVRFAQPLAHFILLEDRCAPLLPYMALSVPFSAAHACINGYYYGIQKTRVPAFAQIVEQIIRMGAVFLISDILLEQGREITVIVAVFGHLIGELASCFYTVFCFCVFPSSHAPLKAQPACGILSDIISGFPGTARPLMTLALPLMGNRLVLNLLASAEAIWIPSRLQLFGLSSPEAFSIYGVLTGMTMPFILFPSTITNSLAVLLLPTVAEAQADGQKTKITQTVSLSLRYSLYMGILCIGVFTLLGPQLGISVFQDESAGIFMQILAWLCPFLYLASTMGSILGGLGKTSTTFVQNTAAMLLRLGFVVLLIPRFGIKAYLWGILASEILLAGLHLRSIHRMIPFTWNVWELIVKPALYLLLSIGIMFAFTPLLAGLKLPAFLAAAAKAGILSLCYGSLLFVSHQARSS